MPSVPLALLRGLRYRCPACGLGSTRPRRGRVPEACAKCAHRFMPDSGEWVGVAETSIFLTKGVGFAAYFALFSWGYDLWVSLGVALALSALAIAATYPRLKGLWIAVSYLWDARLKRAT